MLHAITDVTEHVAYFDVSHKEFVVFQQIPTTSKIKRLTFIPPLLHITYTYVMIEWAKFSK